MLTQLLVQNVQVLTQVMAGQALPHCKSAAAAARVLALFPGATYLAQLDFLPGYHTLRETLVFDLKLLAYEALSYWCMRP
jgi:hypothetical protein